MEPERLKSLAAKITDGTASDEELKAYARHIVHLEKYNEIDELGIEESALLKETMQTEIMNQLFQESTQKKKRKHYYAAVAAALVCGVFVCFYWYLRKEHMHKQFVLAEKSVPIAPGKNQATLTLSDGSTIALSEGETGKIASQGQTEILKTEEGILQYQHDPNQEEAGTPVLNSMHTPIGGQFQLVLPDGSKVWLNAASSITYPTRFTGKERRVKVSGEAYFEIQKNIVQPFVVEMAHQQIEVLGTSFNVKDYPESFSETTLLSGRVKVSAGTSSGHMQEVLLDVGEKAAMERSGLVVRKADIDEVIAWKMGFFKFQDDIKNIMPQIARWYDVEIIYQLDTNKSLAFGGKIARSRPLKEVLRLIEETGNVHFKIEGRRVMVTN